MELQTRSGRAVVLVNRRASRAEGALPDLREILRTSGLQEVDLHVPDDPDDIPEQIRALGRRDGDVDAVIVAGGDGTLHHALPALIETGLPLGVLPLGTANDLARALGLPTEPEKALAVIVRGHTRAIDLGLADDAYFMNVASVGLTGRVTRALDEDEKRRWGVLSYPLEVMNALRQMRPFRVTLTVDGRTEHFRHAVQVSIANGPSFGGGMQIDRDRRIDDGRLSVCVIQARSRWRLVSLVPLLWLGRTRDGEAAEVRDGREVSLETSRPLEVSADGEIAARTPTRFRVEPRVLRVFTEEAPSR